MQLTLLSPLFVFELLEFLFPLLLFQLVVALLLHLPVMLQQLLLMFEGQQILLVLVDRMGKLRWMHRKTQGGMQLQI